VPVGPGDELAMNSVESAVSPTMKRAFLIAVLHIVLASSGRGRRLNPLSLRMRLENRVGDELGI
jgi:hypothetical protein